MAVHVEQWFHLLLLVTNMYRLIRASSIDDPICKTPFVGSEAGKCFFHTKAVPNICEAHYSCATTLTEYGLLSLLVSIDVPKAGIALFTTSSYTTRFWTGLNDLLVERGSNRDGWRGVDINFRDAVFTGKEDSWLPGEPGSGNVIVADVDRTGIKLRTAKSQDAIQNVEVICQLANESVVKSLLQSSRLRQFSTAYPVKLSKLAQTSSTTKDYCLQYRENHSLIRCAFECELSVYCRSVYYKEGRCIHVLFMDSLLPASFANQEGWIRMGRII